MKRNNLMLGSVTVVALAGAVMLVSQWKSADAGYEPVALASSSEAQTIDGFNIWWEAHHINSETGAMMTTEQFQLGLEEMRQIKANQPKVAELLWQEQGPENIGGRTRAIIVDQMNENHIYAGSVSGGLFESWNKGNTWNRVWKWDAFMFITSLCQTLDGTVFVGTGDSQDFAEYSFVGGRGVWYQPQGTDEWFQVPGSEGSNVGELVSSGTNNTIFYCGPGQRLHKWTVGDASATLLGAAEGLPTNGSCSEVEISRDGQVVIAYYSGHRMMVSSNGGNTFTQVSGNGAGQIPTGSGSRFEFSIAPNRVNDQYICYAVGTYAYTGGVFRSSDSGNTWSQIAPGTNDPSSLINFYGLGQGRYNSVIKVDPTNPNRLLLGGLDIHEWQLATNEPVSGGWNQLSLWFVPESSPQYVHADNHDIVFDSQNRMYIGNDGGIGISTNLGQSYIAANRGYNTAQFYSLAHDGAGRLIGGTQDNGTLYNSKNNNQPMEFRQVVGGDGFDAEISFFNPAVMFGTIYYGDVRRSGDFGQSSSLFFPDHPSLGTPGLSNGTSNPNFPFNTKIGLGEFYDENSKDSVLFLPRGNFASGSIINVPSLSTGDTIKYTLPNNVYYDDTVSFTSTIVDYKIRDAVTNAIYYLYTLNYTPFATASGATPPQIGDSLLATFGAIVDTIVVGQVEAYDRYFATHPITGKVIDLEESQFMLNVSWDTLTVQDPFQSIFLLYSNMNGGEIWASRDALRFSTLNPKWSRIAIGIGNMGGAGEFAFSAELEHIYVGSSTGVWRINGLRDVYSTEADFRQRTDLRLGAAPDITKTRIYGNAVAGLSVDPRDKGHLAIARAGTGAGGRVFETNTADIDGEATGNGSFVNISGNLSNNVACYDVLIDRNNENMILVGTDFGLWFTTNGGTSWIYSSEGFGEVPVTRIRQNWREGQEGCLRPGEIYISTFGRGMFATESLVSMPDAADYWKAPGAHVTNINVYPNPMSNNGVIAFELQSKSDVFVEVYSITGRLMKRITQSGMVEGQHQIQFGVNELANGTYIVRLKAGDRIETAKFIKQN